MFDSLRPISVLSWLILISDLRTATADCEPAKQPFTYNARCPGYSNTPITIKKIVASQGSPLTPVNSKGGIDLTKPLILDFSISYDGKPIKKHVYALQLCEYKKDNGGKCGCVSYDLDDIFSEFDMCKEIVNAPCDYSNHPSNVRSKIDFKEMFGDGVSAMNVGRYYKFRLIERDGSKLLNCFELIGKVIKVE